MINNAMQLKAKIKNFAKEKNLDSETVFQEYVLERFIDRISKSKYKENHFPKIIFHNLPKLPPSQPLSYAYDFPLHQIQQNFYF